MCLWTIQAQDPDTLSSSNDTSTEQIESSIRVLSQEILDDQGPTESRESRAILYEKLGQYEKAITDYTFLVEEHSDEEILWYRLGYCQYKIGNYSEALKSLNHATALNPQYLPAYHIKIQALLHLNKVDQALKVSDSTLMIGETAMNYFLQGQVNERMNARQKAEWAYAKATRIDKGFIDAYIAASNLAVEMNKAEEALAAADGALAINPDSEEALLARSRGFAMLKHFDDAIDDISYVIKLNPENAMAYYWRGTYYQGDNKPQDAIKDFDRSLTLNPDYWQALAGKAECSAKIGDKKSALADYEKLLANAHLYSEKETITQLANRQIFELNRETHAPQLILTGPMPENFSIQLPENQKTIILKGIVIDESPIGSFTINGKKVSLTKAGNEFHFETEVATDTTQYLNIAVADVYDNTDKLTYRLVRNEISAPEIALYTPKATDSGVVTVIAGSNTLYIEGKITDDSAIASITIDGKPVDFDQDTSNPVFSSIIDIGNKDAFEIKVTDLYGNTTERTFFFDKIDSATANQTDTGEVTQKPAVENASH